MPLVDYYCEKCGYESLDNYTNKVDDFGILNRCGKCYQAMTRKICQGSYLPFKPYVVDYLEDDIEITSFAEKRRIHKEAGVSETDKRDNKASKGLDGWPQGRQRVATVVRGEVVRHGSSS